VNKISIKVIRCGNLIDGTGKPAVDDAIVVLKGNRIHAVGRQTDVLVPMGAYVIDASGKTVVPGLIDSHTHFLSMGYRLTQLQLEQTNSIKDILSRLSEYIGSSCLDKGKWVLGRGWDDQNLKERRYPNRYDLDGYSPNNPTALARICGHMIVLNSRALEVCGITTETPNPLDGVIDKNQEGEPTGVLRDAWGIVAPHIPQPTYQEVRQGLRNAIDLAHRLGVTTVHDCSSLDESIVLNSTRPYVDAQLEGDLKLRCHVMTWYPREWGGNEWLSFGTMKIGIDGSLGAQTALLYESYADDPSTSGVRWRPREEQESRR
jgi:predicted amidohydrolase YtcJ